MPFTNTEAQCSDMLMVDRGVEAGLDSLSIHFLNTMMRINSDEVYIKKYIQWLENCERCLVVLHDTEMSQL